VIPADPSVAMERADKARVRGEDDASIRLVEISDFQCPFCRQFYDDTYGALDSQYVLSGKIKYVWISYASPSHPLAWSATEAAFCAGAVGMFWSMHDLLFTRQDQWTGADDPYSVFVEYAIELGIELGSFEDCIRNDRMAPLQSRDYANVIQAGINSTPYFIVADSMAIRGAADIGTFQAALDSVLAPGSREAPGGPGGPDEP